MQNSESLVLPFDTYIWKITSRCNLNCSYCYVYNSADSSWRFQPKLMSEEVVRLTAQRILKHCRVHGKYEVSIVFHGGEPLIGGLSHLQTIVNTIEETFADSEVYIHLGIQSNLLLFTKEIGDYLLEKGISLGVSLDGPPEVNDVHRLDHQGQPTSIRLEAKLDLLTSSKYKPIFRGFLCVINPCTDPKRVTEYLLSYEPTGIDFLFPLNNYDRPPLEREANHNITPFGNWLIASYDYWCASSSTTRIRLFESIQRMLCGFSSPTEIIGTTPVTLIVVETNGDIEAVDSLKSTYEGATRLGYNIFEHDFDNVASHFAIKSRQMGVDSLCTKCQNCDLVDICGGGYLPHRYSSEKGFDNPSIYCFDLQLLIRYIYKSLRTRLASSRT